MIWVDPDPAYPGSMVRNLPRRTLADWTSEKDDIDDWLAAWAADGWVPEYADAGLDVVVNNRTVLRFAMIATSPGAKFDDERLAH